MKKKHKPHTHKAKRSMRKRPKAKKNEMQRPGSELLGGFNYQPKRRGGKIGKRLST